MAGTYAERATLANDNAFIAQCRVAMLKWAVSIVTSATVQPFATVLKANNVLQASGSDAPKLAWQVVNGYPTIGNAAPTVPTDAVAQAGVEAVIAVLP